MFIVQKSIERVTVHDKDSANKLIYLLTVSGCADALSKREVIGAQNKGQLFTVKESDTEITVVGQDNAEIVTHWLLGLGINEITVSRVNE
jgi:hypothetical protein